MKLKNILAISATVMSLTLAAIPGTSQAADEKIFSGAGCMPATFEDSGAEVIYSVQGIINPLNEFLPHPTNPANSYHAYVVCPLTRDIVLSRWQRIDVYVRDNSWKEYLTCTAYNHTTHGLNPYSITQKTGAAPSYRGTTTLSFYAPPSDWDRGSFTIACTLPGNYMGNANDNAFSAIYAIRLVEN